MTHLTVLGPSTDHSLTVTYTNILTGERGRGGEREGKVINVKVGIVRPMP